MPGRVFVVDDERLIADTLCAILRSSGYDASAFYDAESTIAACRNGGPDFVLSDVSMPGMNGIEMAIKLQDRFPGCGFLIISGHAGRLEILECARAKGYEFEVLAKPVHPKSVLAILEGKIGRAVECEEYVRNSDAMST
jgi:DNA-binding NtrC family response regulator